MGRFAHAFGPDHPEASYTAHAFPERNFDTGEVALNYAVAGSDDMPALLLIPGQSESWWGYEDALPHLASCPTGSQRGSRRWPATSPRRT